MTCLPKHCFLVTAIAVLMSLNLAYGDDQGESEAAAADSKQEIDAVGLSRAAPNTAADDVEGRG